MQQTVRPQHDIIRFPPPIVRPDVEAQEPPTDKQLTTADPGQKTMAGGGDTPVIDEPLGPVTTPGVTEESTETVFKAVEVEPAPIGGIDNYYKFLGKRINYPTAAKEAGTQGNVILTFVVERDGSLTEIKALRDPGNGLAEEAIRVLKLAPHWTPGIQNGKKVRVQYTIPISFTLGEQ
ncbi:energy transducer TonB [uncultured Mucilaginibacter sp.]|uniref:energy transducer TonB n=1 Tax=uncultured Mucilaginibacter sp. TaxID=797541 RepID=UPI0025EC4012|nr:energy transducer TonB [uncultured Mucilaginibacter sp.]